MFKLGYFILAHDRVDLVNKLIDSLNAPNVYFFIHIDKKSKDKFSNLRKGENITCLSKSYNINWGDISIVDAVISLCNFALASSATCDYYVLLSGHDYPLKNAIEIYDFFKENNSRNYTIGYQLPTTNLNWIDGGLLRLRGISIKLDKRRIATIIPHSFSFTNFRQFIKVLKYCPHKIMQAMNIWFKSKRELPYGLIPYGGEMWFRINRKSLEKIISFTNSHQMYYSFMKDVTIPDEMFFNTLLWNLTDENENVNENLTYINWTGGSSPANIENKSKIIKLIENPRFLFARKFESVKILNFIDSNLQPHV